MALSAIEIYKLLPQTNCRECGFATCLAFAMQLAQKKVALDKCPTASDDCKTALEGAAAPPIDLVTVGTGEGALKIGNETTLFRHDGTFVHPCGLAIEVPSSLPVGELSQRAANLGAMEFDRVGQIHRVDLIALRETPGGTAYAGAAQAVAGTDLPVMLLTDDPDSMAAAAAAVADKRPLLCGANATNFDAMVAVAKQHGLPLVVRGQGLDELADLAQKATEAGVKELVLDSSPQSPAEALSHQTAIRRGALLKKNRLVGHPTLLFPAGAAKAEKILNACVAVAKYAGIIVLDFDDRASLLPVITARLNLYTDPEKPIQVQGGLYEVGTPGDSSPVLVTTNFSLTYYTVEGDVAAAKVPSWIVVVDTSGTSVLTAWAAETFTADTIAKALDASGVTDKVKHHTVIIPGGVAVLSGKLQDQSGWKVVVGPRESAGIPTFLKTLPALE